MNTSGAVSSVLAMKAKPGEICTITPENTVYEAIQKMADHNVGALLVMSGERLVGMITERDYTRKVALRGKQSKNTLVQEILTTNLTTVAPNQSVDECLRLMTQHRIRHLPVVENQKVLGVVSIGDLVNWIITTQGVMIDQLKKYIGGHY
ncbi:MAG: CBS domain-containing protein [Verrucomicrobiota bacterium]